MSDAPLLPPLSETLARWHEFYGLLGAAAATMVALLFVAASLGGSVFATSRQAGLRFFFSATVVNFALILIISLIALAPLEAWAAFGAMIASAGLFGLGYYALAWLEIGREGILPQVDFEDRAWYGALPVIGHLVETAAGVALIWRGEGLAALALALGGLLIVGIHNAWDITIWVIGKKSG
jgi:hypothetical protein